MQCYLCGSTGIEKEGKIYCPSCKIFIADEDKGDTPYVQPMGNIPVHEESKVKTGFHIPIPRFRVIILLLVLLGLGGWFVFSNFLYIDAENNCRITIYPAWFEWSNMNLRRALLALKNAEPGEYKKVCQHVNTINPAIGCGGFEGGCYYTKQSKTIYVSTSQRSLSRAVLVIVHETCHAIQAHEGRAFSETECYEADDAVMQRIVEF